MTWIFETSAGLFSIRHLRDGYFHVFFNDEDLGSYETPELAADDVSGGHTSSISSGIDTAELGISDNLSDWEEVPLGGKRME